MDPQAWAAWYHNPESHSAYQISASGGDLVALGAHFKPRDASHFVSTPGAEIAFDRLQNGVIRATLTFPDSAPQVLERFEPRQPSAEELAQYVGEYTSSELQATYRFAVKDGKLVLVTNWASDLKK